MVQFLQQELLVKRKPINSTHQEVLNSFQQIRQNAYHSKKKDLSLLTKTKTNNNANTDAAQKEVMKSIPSQCMYINDLITDLTPAELDYIIMLIQSTINGFTVTQIDAYTYNIQFDCKCNDFVYNELTEDLDPIEITITINFSIQILKIQDYTDKYTLRFQNFTCDYGLEFNQATVEIVNFIKTF